MRTLFFGTVLVAQAAIIVLMTGCGATFDYTALRDSRAEGDGFAAELAREYKAFALYETDEMRDWPDAAHFGGKALAAASGKVLPPESPKDWRLPKDKVGEITAARAQLVSALDKGAGERWPHAAAKAQVGLDCWIEQQEENWQFDHIAKCRGDYEGAIAEIGNAFAVSEAAADTNAIPAVATRAGGANDSLERSQGLPDSVRLRQRRHHGGFDPRSRYHRGCCPGRRYRSPDRQRPRRPRRPRRLQPEAFVEARRGGEPSLGRAWCRCRPHRNFGPWRAPAADLDPRRQARTAQPPRRGDGRTGTRPVDRRVPILRSADVPACQLREGPLTDGPRLFW